MVVSSTTRITSGLGSALLNPMRTHAQETQTFLVTLRVAAVEIELLPGITLHHWVVFATHAAVVWVNSMRIGVQS